MVICAVSLTACILFHGPCMTSVPLNGAPQGPAARAPPFVPGACRLGGLAAEAPKEEQATV